MKALLIDPIARTVTEVNIGNYRDIAPVLGCSWVEPVQLTPNEDLWVDEVGALAYPNPLGYFSIARHVFCGRGLVTGVDYRTGERTDTHWDARGLANIVEWLDTPPQEQVEPRIEIMEWPNGDD